jgi:hypothetical protein
MDLKIERLGKGEQIAAGSAIALLACMFLSWFNFGYDASNAWESLHYIGPLLAIAIAATLGIAFAKASSRSTGDIPDGMVIFILGGFSALLVLYRLIDPISAPTFEGGSTSASIEAGAFLGLFAAAGIAAGGYIATDGMAIDRLKALLPSAGPGTGGDFLAPPTPPAPVTPPAPTPTAIPAPPASPPTPASAPVAVTPAPQSPPVSEPAAPASVGEESRSVFCENCGAAIRPKDRFCGKCGHEQAPAPDPGA